MIFMIIYSIEKNYATKVIKILLILIWLGKRPVRVSRRLQLKIILYLCTVIFFYIKIVENNLLNRLDGLSSKFDEISTLITDPAIIADTKRFVKLNKEYADLEKIIKKRDEYSLLLKNLQEATDLLATEKDEELREMARQEIDAVTPRIEPLEEEIKLLLAPSEG